jgi:hypothetical protein
MATGSDEAITPDGAMRYRRRMTVESPTQAGRENSHKKSPSFLHWFDSPRFIAFTALAIALIALAAAIAAWLVPTPKDVSAGDSAQAKTHVCTTYVIVRNAVARGTPSPRPNDPVSDIAVAANVRLAMIGGSSYLTATLAENPAAPADLTAAVKSMAGTLDKLGFLNLLRTGPAERQPVRQALNSQIAQINQMCAPKKK